MSTFIFYFLALVSVYGAFNTVLRKDPVTAALHLALTMVSLAGLYFNLGAHFLAGVQLVVYAGAVMVLFVMVIMLFDSTDFKEHSVSNSDRPTLLIIVVCTMLLGFLFGIIPHSVGLLNKVVSPEIASTKMLSQILFSKYVFMFEWLGLLLLVIAVGVVVLTRCEKFKDNIKNELLRKDEQ